MATPHPALGHARQPSVPARPAVHRRLRPVTRLRSGILLGATAALTVGLMPGTATAAPARPSTPQQAAALVADASHRLEVVSEQVNEAREELARQRAAAEAADRAADAAQQRLHGLDGQIRRLARGAYQRGGDSHLTQLDVLLTSDSADAFVSQLGTLNALAGHTNQVVAEVSRAADDAARARDEATAAAAKGKALLDGVTARQADLTKKIAAYKRQYAALTAAQKAQVTRARTGTAGAAPAVGPPAAGGSGAAQAAVRTALAQVGDRYVWGATGPNTFDCSGLTQYAYAAAGLSLPHSSGLQSRMGKPVSRSQLQPGDLIFFYSPVSHVAMYIGNGQMVHAATSGEPVKVVSVGSMPGYHNAQRILG